MTNVVVDASVAVKWFLPSTDAEQDGEQAVSLLQGVKNGRIVLREPPHWLAEIAAVLSRLSPSTAREDVELLHAMHIPIIETPGVYATACELAVTLNQHVFDTLYHAVALLIPECTLVTADERYYRRARKLGAITLLADFDPS